MPLFLAVSDRFFAIMPNCLHGFRIVLTFVSLFGTIGTYLMINRKGFSMLKRFIAYYKPHKKMFILDMIASLFISVIGICGFRAFWVYTVFAINHDWNVLFLSYPVSWILTAVVQYICYHVIQKKMPKTDMPSATPAETAA